MDTNRVLGLCNDVIVAACNAETYHLSCFCGSVSNNKWTKFGSRYIGVGSSERDEILPVYRGDVVDVSNSPDWWTLAQGVFLGSQNIEGSIKKFRNAFVEGGLTDLDKKLAWWGGL